MSMAGRFELSNEARLDALESLVSSRWLTVSGNFVQSGGEAVLDNLEVVVLGRYEMSGGSLSSRNFQMHGGRFELAGGRMAPGYFRIRPPQQPDDLAGVFTVRGGTLVLDQGISENSLGIDFESGAWTLDVPSGIAALDTSRMSDVSAATLRTGPNSLVVLPAGVELSDFATVDAQGMVHRNGTTLTIPQGRTVSGGGNLSDYVAVEGTLRNEEIDNPYASDLNLNGGVSVGPTASVDLGDGTLIANGRASELRGGELRASSIYVGHRQAWRIQHSAEFAGANNTFLDMTVGMALGVRKYK